MAVWVLALGILVCLGIVAGAFILFAGIVIAISAMGRDLEDLQDSYVDLHERKKHGK